MFLEKIKKLMSTIFFNQKISDFFFELIFRKSHISKWVIEKCGKFASEKNVENNLRAKKMWKMSDFDELYPFVFGENLIFQNEWSKNVENVSEGPYRVVKINIVKIPEKE